MTRQAPYLFDSQLRNLLAAVTELRASLPPPAADDQDPVAERLDAGVTGPLRRTMGHLAELPRSEVDVEAPGQPRSTVGQPEPLAERLYALALSASRLRTVGSPAGLGEAAAHLQDLALRLTPEPEREHRLAELAEAQAELPRCVQTVAGGPYLLTNVAGLQDHLGVSIDATPTTALCRCGKSPRKPICTGACHRTGFDDRKDPNRVADQRDRYVGQQVTILDNRGSCQHSGLCTDRLAGVFHLGEEPFVTPSGGRMDEIVRAVRDCPSGALSYAVDGVEARDQVDWAGRRDVTVTVTQDGPYRVTGGVPLLDEHSEDVPRNRGASREHYALCRCGQSQNKPFCSGMHFYAGFRDPTHDLDHVPTMFEWCGGLPALTRMTRLFYERHVPSDSVLGPVFANMSADHPQRVAKWLAEVFGGPPYYSSAYGGYHRMLSEHVGKQLTEGWRARWVALMAQSAAEAGLPNDPEFRSAFTAYLEWGSRLAVENSQTTSRPPERMPMPHWDWGVAGPPGFRPSALPPPEEDQAPVVLPAQDEPVRYEKHIKPLFRARDRQSMGFAFDLWSYHDVRTHADAILARVRGGTMPCDAAWPAEQVEVLQRWVSQDCPA